MVSPAEVIMRQKLYDSAFHERQREKSFQGFYNMLVNLAKTYGPEARRKRALMDRLDQQEEIERLNAELGTLQPDPETGYETPDITLRREEIQSRLGELQPLTETERTELGLPKEMTNEQKAKELIYGGIKGAIKFDEKGNITGVDEEAIQKIVGAIPEEVRGAFGIKAPRSKAQQLQDIQADTAMRLIEAGGFKALKKKADEATGDEKAALNKLVAHAKLLKLDKADEITPKDIQDAYIKHRAANGDTGEFEVNGVTFKAENVGPLLEKLGVLKGEETDLSGMGGEFSGYMKALGERGPEIVEAILRGDDMKDMASVIGGMKPEERAAALGLIARASEIRRRGGLDKKTRTQIFGEELEADQYAAAAIRGQAQRAQAWADDAFKRLEALKANAINIQENPFAIANALANFTKPGMATLTGDEPPEIATLRNDVASLFGDDPEKAQERFKKLTPQAQTDFLNTVVELSRERLDSELKALDAANERNPNYRLGDTIERLKMTQGLFNKMFPAK